MPSMLEQAIVDAEVLKEVAVKNAEQTIIEKYSQEVKKAVDLMLEQPEEMGMAPPMDPGAAMGMPPMDPGMADMGPPPEIVDAMPLASSEDEDICPCPRKDDVVTINFDQLRTQMQEEMEEEGGLDMSEMQPSEEVADEMGALAEELEFDDDILDNLDEEITIDIEPVKSGHLETPTEHILNAENEAEAHAAAPDEDDEDEDDKRELEEAILRAYGMLEALRGDKKELTEQNNKFKQSILQMKKVVDEVNTENAKLLFTNKALCSPSLNERQKKQIVESMSNASTVEEAKVIYETLQSTVGSPRPRREQKPQSLSEAVNRRSSTLLSNNREEKQESNPFSERMKKLAGIN